MAVVVHLDLDERATALVSDAREEVERLAAEVARLEAARDEIRAGALAFLLSAYEPLDRHEGIAVSRDGG